MIDEWYTLFYKQDLHKHCCIFQEAKKLGIHRTVHAGENGTAENVWEVKDSFYVFLGLSTVICIYAYNKLYNLV